MCLSRAFHKNHHRYVDRQTTIWKLLLFVKYFIWIQLLNFELNIYCIQYTRFLFSYFFQFDVFKFNFVTNNFISICLAFQTFVCGLADAKLFYNWNILIYFYLFLLFRFNFVKIMNGLLLWLIWSYNFILMILINTIIIYQFRFPSFHFF